MIRLASAPVFIAIPMSSFSHQITQKHFHHLHKMTLYDNMEIPNLVCANAQNEVLHELHESHLAEMLRFFDERTPVSVLPQTIDTIIGDLRQGRATVAYWNRAFDMEKRRSIRGTFSVPWCTVPELAAAA